MQEPFAPPLEPVMKNTDAYLSVCTISLLLATSIVHAIQTLLAMRARTIFPLLRIQAGQHCTSMITSARIMDAIISPHCATSYDHNIDLSYATFTQPRRPL